MACLHAISSSAAASTSHASALGRTCSLPRSPLLQQSRPARWLTRADPAGGGEEITDSMKADLARYQNRSRFSPLPDGRVQTTSSQNPAEPTAMSGIKEGLDKLMIADFFLVLFALSWLGAGVAWNSVSGDSALLDAWYPLWPTLWQSAIGLLMAGALLSGGLGWLAEQKQKEQ